MFWKRNKNVIKSVAGLQIEAPPVPQKKEFSTMLEMLRDAEKYDNQDEKQISESILTELCEYIKRLKSCL